MEKKIFNIASFPVRVESLKEVMKNILLQADLVYVYLNDYDTVPDFLLDTPKIHVFLGNSNSGDIGAAGKFYACDEWPKGYIFTVDDDIIYPLDYADKMIEAIEKYGRKCVASCHGRTYRKPGNILHYYSDVIKYLSYSCQAIEDTFVHMIGTGVAAWHTDLLSFDHSVFTVNNSVDLEFCAYLQKFDIPRLVIAHESHWVTPCPLSPKEYSISGTYVKNPGIKTTMANVVPWSVSCCAPVL